MSNNQDLTPELIPDVGQSVVFDATVPSTALGDASGVVSFLLSLVADPSITTNMDVQIDVFRTRGLDLTGATGMNASTGHGRPGQTAKAWFMVENLGNAPESTTSITWTAPSWGGSPSIHDTTGKLFSIVLDPGESKEPFAHLHRVRWLWLLHANHLTLCMGSGEDALCEPCRSPSQRRICSDPIPSSVPPRHRVDLVHRRNGPDLGRPMEHEYHGHAPARVVVVGHGTLRSTGPILWHKVRQGTPSAETSSWVPQNPVPKRHAFADVDSNDADASLNISLHVLQVFRANLNDRPHTFCTG